MVAIVKHDLVQNVYTGRVGFVWEVKPEYVLVEYNNDGRLELQREDRDSLRCREEGK